MKPCHWQVNLESAKLEENSKEAFSRLNKKLVTKTNFVTRLFNFCAYPGIHPVPNKTKN